MKRLSKTKDFLDMVAGNSIKRRFWAFSVTLFLSISILGSTTFIISMQGITHSNRVNELQQILEIERIKLEALMKSEIAIALKMANSPLIQRYFADPSNFSLKRLAIEEIAEYRQTFASKSIFWVNDIDKKFHFNESNYTVDLNNPENYWYNMTLHETEKYNFNINYNPILQRNNLWLNAPVFGRQGRPVGMVGTGIELSAFTDTIYKNYTGNAELYFFNREGEITGARDVSLAANRTHISKHLGDIGTEILNKAENLLSGQMQSFTTENKEISVSTAPILGWYVAVIQPPMSMQEYLKNDVAIIFLVMLGVIAFTFIIFNVSINGLVRPLTKSQQAAREAQLRAEQANTAKSKFLATMSHEIRTPMNAIIGITEIELNNEEHSGETQDSLHKIYNSSFTLLGIINDILDLSKIESGKLEIHPVEYSIADIVNDTVQLNQLRIGDKPIDFVLRVSEDLPANLIGDELRIKQILNNLLSNAFKYTNKGKVTLEFKAQRENAETVCIIITVRDTGQGMSAEQVSKLFTEYTRFNVESNRAIEGTGLGLSITKRLVELMQGSIAVESVLGIGSVFTVKFLQQATNHKTIGKELAENLQNFRFSCENQARRAQIVREYMPYGSVLIVDDAETNLFVAKGLLMPYGLKIETAGSGFETLDKIKAGNKYSIIFMDHMMPKMDGIETVKLIREAGYKHPIVALTANAVAGQAEIFANNGFDGFISKPIDIRLLNATLNKMIRDKQSPEVIEAARQQKAAAPASLPKNAPSNADLLAFFAQDTKKSLPIFENTLQNIANATDEDLRLFAINIHAMKSALANIGEKEASEQAALLEKAGKEQNKNIIQTETQNFVNSLKAIVEKIEAKAAPNAKADENPVYLREQLQVIGIACTAYDEQSAGVALANLQKMQWTKETKAILEQIAESLLFSDFEKAREISESFSQRR
ncbi:MAG: response regulator [Fibromonadaceae bacterium]|jgi:signal transduction histidine kinase/CheY-like chemotaxis protein/HPt (histidine-containing phosphotransfer) domain-containing protein|nr:response regulator [Fibromonadaceae bacterium]